MQAAAQQQARCHGRARGRLAGSSPLAARPLARPHLHAPPRGFLDGLFGGSSEPKTELAPKEPQVPGCKLATFAGGCFWGLELAYQRVPGVAATSVGYTAGKKPGPSYREVCSGGTGHTEAVQVTYDPKEVAYEALLELFFDRVDPTTPNKQGNDNGSQYRSGIYFHDLGQQMAAQQAMDAIAERLRKGEPVRPEKPEKGYAGKKVVSELEPASDFWLAEDYHQQFLAKGGKGGRAQSAEKGCKTPIRCYG